MDDSQMRWVKDTIKLPGFLRRPRRRKYAAEDGGLSGGGKV